MSNFHVFVAEFNETCKLERNKNDRGSLGLPPETLETMGTYSFSGSPTFVTIGVSGTYDLDAFGAQGGADQYGNSGGLGAEEGARFSFTAGQVLEIVVGGRGGNAQAGSYGGGGGGGGTFVFLKTGTGTYQTLVVAGGGGGAYKAAGGNAVINSAGSGAGGTAGGSSNFAGGGGAGRYGAGGSSTGVGNGTGGSAQAGNFSGGAGGSGTYGLKAGAGGFGGGGGGGIYSGGGGGGGGSTGGNGGYQRSGAGGTSTVMVSLTNVHALAGANSGDGRVLLNLVPCFSRGTLIETNRGPVPVEILAIGDTVVTAAGQHRSIRWIGRRSYARRFLAANPGAQPVRFRAGSLGDGLPRRDLLVSADHAMFLDGVLVPAGRLVNGTTVVRDRGVERVEYFHIELDTHDVILAEGAPAETFIDADSRGLFHNAREFSARYPDAPPPAGFCAPRVEDGPVLEALRRRLAACVSSAA